MKERYVLAINGETKEEACAAYHYNQWCILHETREEALDEGRNRFGSGFKIIEVTEEEFSRVHGT